MCTGKHSLRLKLESHGINGALLEFLRNYLSNRTQSVFVNSSMSTFKTTNAGVPQGSVLGPLMFLIYVNDIADNLLNISRLFADDTSVSSSSADVHEIKRSIEHDMNEILDWSVKWKVSLILQKQNFYSLVTVLMTLKLYSIISQ